MARIKHDAFARFELHRIRDYGKNTCVNCDGQNTTPLGRKFVYKYAIVKDDDPRQRMLSERWHYCSASCRSSFLEAI